RRLRLCLPGGHPPNFRYCPRLVILLNEGSGACHLFSACAMASWLPSPPEGVSFQRWPRPAIRSTFRARDTREPEEVLFPFEHGTHERSVDAVRLGLNASHLELVHQHARNLIEVPGVHTKFAF